MKKRNLKGKQLYERVITQVQHFYHKSRRFAKVVTRRGKVRKECRCEKKESSSRGDYSQGRRSSIGHERSFSNLSRYSNQNSK